MSVGVVTDYDKAVLGIDRVVASESDGFIAAHAGVIFGYYDHLYGELNLITNVLRAEPNLSEMVMGRVDIVDMGQKVSTLTAALLRIVVGTEKAPGELADIISADELLDMLKGTHVVRLSNKAFAVPNEFSSAIFLIIDVRVQKIFTRVPDEHRIKKFNAIPWREFKPVVTRLHDDDVSDIQVSGYPHTNVTLKVLKQGSDIIDGLKERVIKEFLAAHPVKFSIQKI